MKPIIGITMNEREDDLYIKDHYVKRVLGAGGVPILLPNHLVSEVNIISKKIHGLLLTGGTDVGPAYFDQEPHPEIGRIMPLRDAFEAKITKQMLTLNKPIFAICRGAQMLNIVAGGEMYQHLSSLEIPDLIKHDQNGPIDYRSHSITIEMSTKLYQLISQEHIRVNSYHHQAIQRVVDPFIVSARSADDVVEAIESTKHRFAVGVQWHPECLKGVDSDRLFKSFIEESSEVM